ncbi:rhomboid family intramembrane serine protease [Bhargavaea cecembensis]|uniref:rhomboid family intramembrane serine protease n=1 Tax=Bhargavaea cecembensis TaxID=394098 RepID=UPI0015CF3FB4|nr:rhomboid family intramembrane serine protease [Bhargavaea cecembensis]
MEGVKPYPTRYILILLITAASLPALLLPASLDTLHQAFGISRENLLDGKYWTPFTFSLFHRSFAHYLFNIVLITWMSKQIETAYGSTKMAGLVLLSVITSSTAVIVSSDFSSVIGASGIVFGMLGVYSTWAVLYPNDLSKRYKISMEAILLVNLFVHWLIFRNGLAISISAHVGGFVGGVLFGVLDRLPARRRRRSTYD